ncbi:ammonium transporter NrgA [bacterium BMS3Abin10]|nr:ammonium transporter NrgA [bacterium BMS3Abin10]GBE39470.1 ammonium transporter NrgA [bacterium BMS3Bbin08]
MKSKFTLAVILFFLIFPGVVYAQDLSSIDSGDTAWLLISTALVMLMIPGLALFYGGMVRRKNVLSTLMQCFVIMCVVGLQWILWGYSLAFGPDKWGIIGGLEWLGLNSVGLSPSPDYASTVPHQAFMIFQGMFAAITPALIIGAFAERMKFSTLLIFTLLWTTLVYDPVCHWVWGTGGWLGKLGVLDFAGGIVVHLSSGIAALIAALMMGKRRGYLHEPMPPHNLPMTVLGAALLWFGWFGFNAGSSLSSGALAVSAFVVTNTAAVAAALTWAIIEWRHRGNPTVLGIVTGAVAGLATITPASGFVGPMSAIVIGIAAGVFCYIAVSVIKPKLGYDDSLDVFGVHGIGGIWGVLAVGLFASTAINPDGVNGLFFGNPAQIGIQAIGIVAVLLYSLVVTWVILKILDVLLGLRVSVKDEIMGLDLSQHSESGYTILE